MHCLQARQCRQHGRTDDAEQDQGLDMTTAERAIMDLLLNSGTASISRLEAMPQARTAAMPGECSSIVTARSSSRVTLPAVPLAAKTFAGRILTVTSGHHPFDRFSQPRPARFA
jgi:hypothetical protein